MKTEVAVKETMGAETIKEVQKDGVTITKIKDTAFMMDIKAYDTAITAVIKSAEGMDGSAKGFFLVALKDYEIHKGNKKVAFDIVKERIDSFKGKTEDSHLKRLHGINGITWDFAELKPIVLRDALTFANIEAVTKMLKLVKRLSENGKKTLPFHVADKEDEMLTLEEAKKRVVNTLAKVADKKRQELLKAGKRPDVIAYNNDMTKAISALSHSFGIIETEFGLVGKVYDQIVKAIEGNKLHGEALAHLQTLIAQKVAELSPANTVEIKVAEAVTA